MRRWHIALPLVFLCCAYACGGRRPEITRIEVRAMAPSDPLAPGSHRLGSGTRWVHGVGLKHDGYLTVPRRASATRVPLLVLLHGGGGRSEDFNEVLPLADEFGVAIAAIDSRDNTWDAIDSPWGPDVVSLDHTLRYIFEHVAVDPARVALGGLSDGGFYALSLGLANGDLFTHLVAVAPGYMRPPRPLVGHPKILLLHGSHDNVYSVASSLRLVPELQSAGYDVVFKEFDGPHWLPASVAREVLAWMLR